MSHQVKAGRSTGSRISRTLAALRHDEDGGVMVEYVLLTLLVSVTAYVGMTLLGRNASNKMNNASAAIE
jgi:Flp pilus assembly pilin Flp